VFSGGKLELRKGQDLALAAFRAFHRRHPEALLLTAWHSPWSDLMNDAVAHPGLIPPRATAEGVPDVVGWAVANGVPPDAVIAIGPTPNIAMPHVIREADVALFPNRAEGGTNLVAMECMACGIPTILSANTGHLDLLRTPGVAIPLTRQAPIIRAGLDTTDWGGERRGGGGRGAGNRLARPRSRARDGRAGGPVHGRDGLEAADRPAAARDRAFAAVATT
jgi:glycosyltransferase involved in cell wall biosynthesis